MTKIALTVQNNGTYILLKQHLNITLAQLHKYFTYTYLLILSNSSSCYSVNGEQTPGDVI